MKLLAVETATEACSVALWVDGQVLEETSHQAHGHALTLLPMIESVMSRADVSLRQMNALAFGKGPGAFTGLRVGLGVVQGLALSWDLPVIPVSSLAGLAQAQSGDNILAALDARMNQVYFGAYQRNKDGLVELVGQEQVCFPNDISVPDAGQWNGAGSGWDVYHDHMSESIGSHLQAWKANQFPHATHIATLALE